MAVPSFPWVLRDSRAARAEPKNKGAPWLVPVCAQEAEGGWEQGWELEKERFSLGGSPVPTPGCFDAFMLCYGARL